MKKIGLVTLLMLVALVVGLGLGTMAAPALSPTGVVAGSSVSTSTRLPVLSPVVNPVQPAPASPRAVIDEQSVIEDLYVRENPSVVNVTIYGQQGRQVVPLGEGSGFVFDASGDIVTNAHVVQHADQLEVTFADGTVEAAKVVGQDLNSDLAVVKVDQLPTKAQPLALAQMSDLAVGETVVAIGNPFGLDGSISKGIISALGRNILSLTSFAIPQAIQTDAAINPGNSGGPLLDLQGHVVGVNAQIATGNGASGSNSGVGFAIPVNIVAKVIPELIKNGKYDWAWLGIRGGDVTPSLVQAMNLPVTRGAYIAEASAGGPAAQAGLRGASSASTVNGRAVQVGGDVVTAINGEPVKAFDDLLIYIALQTQPGQEVTLTLVRNGQTQDVKMRLGTRPGVVALSQPAATPDQG